MTKGTGVKPLLPGKMTGIEDVFPCRFSGMGAMPGYVLGARAMTAFTIYSIHNACAIEGGASAFHLIHFRIGAMTFHTLTTHLFPEIHHSQRISRAVTPAVERN